jgi:protoporphyrinogen oxidase
VTVATGAAKPAGGAGEHHDVVVVGAGVSGLATAWHLRDLDVLVLEEAERIGGRIRSVRRGDTWLNFGAHVYGGDGTATDRLLRGLGVTALPLPGQLAALAYAGKVVTSPVETYPFRLPLPARSRAALIRAGLRLRYDVARYDRMIRPRPGESAAERQDRVVNFMDDESFSDRIGPLPPDVDAMFRCTLTRSSGEPEELDLCAVFPEVTRRIEDVVIQRWPRGIPFAHVGRGRLQAPLTRPLGRLHLVGDYLGTRYVETCAENAEAAALRIREQLRTST